MGVALQFNLFTKYLGPSWGDKETVQHEKPQTCTVLYTQEGKISMIKRRETLTFIMYNVLLLDMYNCYSISILHVQYNVSLHNHMKVNLYMAKM